MAKVKRAGDFESLKLSITNLLALFEVAGDTSDKELSFNERSSLFCNPLTEKKALGYRNRCSFKK